MPTHRPDKGANCRLTGRGFSFKRAARLGVIAGIALGMTFIFGCDDNDAAIIAPPPPLVSVINPEVREVTPWDVYPGRLAAIPTVEVRARVSGFIEEAPFEEGAIVQ